MDEISDTRASRLYDRLNMSKESLMALNDGIFAIAITLLVLEIRFPDIPGSQVDTLFLSTLGTIAPNLLGFALSFFIIASYWLSFHRIMYFTRHIDRTLSGLNIFFLFFIAFMPFPTSLLGLYGDRKSVVIFYAVIIALSSIFLFFMWRHAATNHRLIDPALDDRFVEYITMRTLSPVIIFLVSIVIAVIYPLLAMFSWVSIAIFYPLIKWKYRPVEKT